MPPLTLSATLESLVPWLALVGLGAFHGLNPAMGWLFAVALGLQQQSRHAVLVALLPITLGHAASVLLVAALLGLAGSLIPLAVLQLITAGALLLFGLYKLVRYYRHPRWVGMRVGLRDLFHWSFLMATAHGAGLMLAPALLGMSDLRALFLLHHHPARDLLTFASTPLVWGLAIGLHTLAMFLTMVAVAWLIYQYVGLAVLRQRWINFDLLWAMALLVVGALTLLLALSHNPLYLAHQGDSLYQTDTLPSLADPRRSGAEVAACGWHLV